MVNGNLNNGSAGGKLITPAKLTQAKKLLPTSVHDDTRNDLLKAIRDGNYCIAYDPCLRLVDSFDLYFVCRYQTA